MEEIDHLFETLIESDKQKRSETLKKITGITDPAASECLKKYLKSDNYLQQYAAKTALKNIELGGSLNNHLNINTKSNINLIDFDLGNKKSIININEFFQKFQSRRSIVIIASIFMAAQIFLLLFYSGSNDVTKNNSASNSKIESLKNPTEKFIEKNNMKLNQITESNGSYYIKIQGTVVEIDNKKNEAVITINSNRDKCLIKFENTVIFKTGNQVEVTGVIIKNDNLSVPVIKSQNFKVL